MSVPYPTATTTLKNTLLTLTVMDYQGFAISATARLTEEVLTRISRPLAGAVRLDPPLPPPSQEAIAMFLRVVVSLLAPPPSPIDALARHHLAATDPYRDRLYVTGIEQDLELP